MAAALCGSAQNSRAILATEYYVEGGRGVERVTVDGIRRLNEDIGVMSRRARNQEV